MRIKSSTFRRLVRRELNEMRLDDPVMRELETALSAALETTIAEQRATTPSFADDPAELAYIATHVVQQDVGRILRKLTQRFGHLKRELK